MFQRTSKTTPFTHVSAALLSVGLLACSAFAGTPDAKDVKDKIVVPPSEPKWYISLGGNTDFDIHAVYQTVDAVGTVFNLPASVESRTFGATHDQPYSVHLELGYCIAKQAELFGTVYYDGAGSDETRVGRVTDPLGLVGAAGGKYDLNAEFDDYHSVGIELGLRYFFLPKTSRFRPYVSISAGGRYIDSQDVTFRAAGRSTTVSFYDDSFALSTSLLTGVEFALTERFSVGFESGISYHFEQSERDERIIPASASQLTGGINNLQGANDDGDRLYIPVAVYGKFRF